MKCNKKKKNLLYTISIIDIYNYNHFLYLKKQKSLIHPVFIQSQPLISKKKSLSNLNH
jgi:hypothetical protein